MAAIQLAKKAVTLPPTVRTLASGVPGASFVNFSVREPAGHGHGHASGPRSDVPPSWAGGLSRSPLGGLVSKSAVNAPTTGFVQKRLLHASVPAKDAPQVPDFSHYEAKSESANRSVSYFMIGSLGLLSASVAKSTVTEFLSTMAASADVLAMARVEVELANIPEGKNVIIKWRGKPVFIRHRTQDEIKEAQGTDWKTLRDPQPDDARTKRPEWLVMLGVCTHLGCVPIGEAGDYGGWFCPCHGSHYDICASCLLFSFANYLSSPSSAGRVRKGPAPVSTFLTQIHDQLN
ncbi:hypothetical protein AcW1_000288 [Taiwanofungus camphoratus]|nr:hypothetical protein AcW1_000288 [Antrodia cinnamomea]